VRAKLEAERARAATTAPEASQGQEQARPMPPVRPAADAGAASLRAAVNQVIGELEDAAEHIKADDHSYWKSNYLPSFEWSRHRDLIAQADDDAYQMTRTAYREIDRVERCIQHQRISDEMGVAWLPEEATVARCKPDLARFHITNALSALRELSRGVAKS
jgi:hypothetical protein